MNPRANPAPGYRLLLVSIRHDYHLVGQPSTHPVDTGAVPHGAGTRFASLGQIERYLRQQLRGLTSYWQVRVLDDTGTVVWVAFRAGPNGTGNTWTPFRPPASHPGINQPGTSHLSPKERR